MHLKSLQIQNFRNIQRIEEEFNPNFNLIVGGNAQGKTNLLEAIYVLTSVRSFRTSRSSELINRGKMGPQDLGCLIQGKLSAKGMDNILKMSIRGQGKRLELNGKEAKSTENIINQFKTVVFTPDDLLVIKGGPELRRRYIDMFTYNIRPGHWPCMKRYQTVLHHRNRLLKAGMQGGPKMEPWERQLVDLGVEVIKARCISLQELKDSVVEVYGRLAGPSSPKISIQYKSSIPTFKQEEFLLNPEDLKEAFFEALDKSRVADQVRGLTLIGPHRDDLLIEIGDKHAREYGSQGQQRMLTLALKFGEVSAIARNWGEQPILLLDDISSELDREKNKMLLALVSEFKSQVFLSTTDPKLALPDGLASYGSFRMNNGVLEALS